MHVEQSPRDRPPSGDQFAIAYADAQVQISQVGATLRHFTVGGRNVIDGFAVDERATDGRGQVLAPWPNRLTDGRYRYRDCACGERSCGGCKASPSAPSDPPER
jgi:hypothetical protein